MTIPDDYIYDDDEEIMSYQEKTTIVSIISTLLSFTAYCVYILQRYDINNLDSADDFSFWGAAIILLIPVQIVFQIIVHILFAIGYYIVTREEPPDLTDELDKLIELRSVRIFTMVFMIGFSVSMGAIALDAAPSAMFIGLFFTMIIAGILSDVFKLYLYRRGV